MISKKPFFNVVKVFQETYHMRGDKAIRHLIICLSCGHWREIQSKFNNFQLIGRQFSCEKCK